MNRVFVLGAGASAHAGAPLGNNILKKYIELRLNKLEKEKVALSSYGKNLFITPILGVRKGRIRPNHAKLFE